MASDIIVDDSTVDVDDTDENNNVKFKAKKRRSPTYQHYIFNDNNGRWNCKYCK